MSLGVRHSDDFGGGRAIWKFAWIFVRVGWEGGLPFKISSLTISSLFWCS